MRNGSSALRVIGGSLVLLALMAGGCASPQMKGTPFYTGEYSRAVGPVEDRVNLWPLAYYRDPALSILWPLFEHTDDHVALRPVFSVYGTSEDHPVVNVLWPLARFDTRTGESHVMNVSWGPGECTVFPLYWHRANKDGSEICDALVPLWFYGRDRTGYSTHVLWPFFHVKNRGEETGWRVWPLLGRYREAGDDYRFYAWPLGHVWREADGDGGDALLPFYFRSYTQNRRCFVSLPYSSWRMADGDGGHCVFPLWLQKHEDGKTLLLSPLYMAGGNDSAQSSWRVVPPLFYRARSPERRVLATPVSWWGTEGNETRWGVLPALSVGYRSGSEGAFWAVGGAAHARWSQEEHTQYVFPFYYSSTNRSRRVFASPLWTRVDAADGTDWSCVPFLYYGSENAEGDTRVITPLYGHGRDGQGHWGWQTALPLFYRQFDDDGSVFSTLLGGVHENAEGGRRWLCYPLLSSVRIGKGEGDIWALAPLIRASWRKNASRHHVLPLYYWNGEKDTLLSLGYSQWANADGSKTKAVPMALTWRTEWERRTDWWCLGPLAHVSVGEDRGASHVFPFCYIDPAAEVLATPLYARWRAGATMYRCVPPLLSGSAEGPEGKTRIALLGLYGDRQRTSTGGVRRYLFPLYYADTESEAMITPLFAQWRNGDAMYHVIPPVLSGVVESSHERCTSVLLGLFQHRRQKVDGASSGHLIPLYLYDDDRLLLTPLFGWKRGDPDGFMYPLTPLAGRWFGETPGWWVFPLYSHRVNPQTDYRRDTFLWGGYERHDDVGRCGLLPLFHIRWRDAPDKADLALSDCGDYGSHFWSLPWVWSHDLTRVRPAQGDRINPKAPAVSVEQVRNHGCVPLWSYWRRFNAATGREESSTRILLMLYDSKHRVIPANDDLGAASDYTRRRILWRVWHYEKLNGDVSVDLFPGITYDRRSDGFRKVSFMWRLFRHERGPEGRKLDICFLPVIRSGGDK